MPLKLLESVMSPIYQQVEKLTFPEILLESRSALGISQIRAAGFMGIGNHRLGLLECGEFVRVPTTPELLRMAELFGISYRILHLKACRHVQTRGKIKNKKARNAKKRM